MSAEFIAILCALFAICGAVNFLLGKHIIKAENRLNTSAAREVKMNVQSQDDSIIYETPCAATHWIRLDLKSIDPNDRPVFYQICLWEFKTKKGDVIHDAGFLFKQDDQIFLRCNTFPAIFDDAIENLFDVYFAFILPVKQG